MFWSTFQGEEHEQRESRQLISRCLHCQWVTSPRACDANRWAAAVNGSTTLTLIKHCAFDELKLDRWRQIDNVANQFDGKFPIWLWPFDRVAPSTDSKANNHFNLPLSTEITHQCDKQPFAKQISCCRQKMVTTDFLLCRLKCGPTTTQRYNFYEYLISPTTGRSCCWSHIN